MSIHTLVEVSSSENILGVMSRVGLYTGHQYSHVVHSNINELVKFSVHRSRLVTIKSLMINFKITSIMTSKLKGVKKSTMTNQQWKLLCEYKREYQGCTQQDLVQCVDKTFDLKVSQGTISNTFWDHRKETLQATTTLHNFLLQYENTLSQLLSAIGRFKDELNVDMKFIKKYATIDSLFTRHS